MNNIHFGVMGVLALFSLSIDDAIAESTGFMYLSPDQSYCRAYNIDEEGNLLSFFRANDTIVKITATPSGIVNATCMAKPQGDNLVREKGETEFPLDMCSIRHEEGGFETTVVVDKGQVVISETGEISMVCHGIPAASK
ncbi:MAG: hypothetical protein LC541_05245 [Candidatus Thiodiazotropha sp.]|nr:hypothetical protein [Candidatus Thiodiazotropha sp.]MCM8882722.1 hypothetical protein [Candidatus Thiodiazotropha sp.]MCM8920795.1 hypothetical protein [Candidatus Thiodiazotropha sp.]